MPKIKNVSRLIALFMALVLTLGMLPSVAAENAESTGIDYGAYYLVIDEMADFLAFRDDVNVGTDYTGKSVLLVADINLSGEPWMPIRSASRAFKGTFDGGTIKNLTAQGSITTSGSNVAGIVGSVSSSGVIENCRNDVDVTITGQWMDMIGGIAGWMFGGIIENCYNIGVINGVTSGGGIVGQRRSGEPNYCYNAGSVTAISNLYEFDVGELTGWMYKVNNWFPNYGCSRYQLRSGDVVEWVYTCNLGIDVGGYYAVGG